LTKIQKQSGTAQEAERPTVEVHASVRADLWLHASNAAIIL
jgi:hypothetical protein